MAQLADMLAKLEEKSKATLEVPEEDDDDDDMGGDDGTTETEKKRGPEASEERGGKKAKCQSTFDSLSAEQKAQWIAEFNAAAGKDLADNTGQQS